MPSFVHNRHCEDPQQSRMMRATGLLHYAHNDGFSNLGHAEPGLLTKGNAG